MSRRMLLLCQLMAVFSLAQGQETSVTAVQIMPMWGDQDLKADGTVYRADNGDSIRITALRFYISPFRLTHAGATVWEQDDGYHLVDIDKPGSMEITLAVPEGINASALSFELGVDSSTSEAGAMGGDLDPVNGMYWTWQSGYINFKLEGTSTRSTARHHQFALHLGGFAFPNNSVRTVTLERPPGSRVILLLDIRNMLKGTDLAALHHIMSPGPETQRLMDQAVSSFKTAGR